MPNEDLSVPVPDRWGRQAWVDAQTYRREYERSIADPTSFWSEQAATLDWYRVPRQIQHVSFDPHDLRIRWFEDGEINASVNCLDRHLVHAGRTALIWEGDDPSERRKLSYGELHAAVCRLANGLRELGVRKGDRVTIYLPMVPEAAIAMLACARIGAVHSVVFGGFSAESLAGRIRDCGSQVLITADESVRGGRSIAMKASADEAMRECPSIAHCVVLRRTGARVGWTEGRDCWYHDLVRRQALHCEPEVMLAEDPLFILYTSGSTGRPKGVVHTTAGYLLAASLTHRYVFDYRNGDVFWCTADIGWVTGHSYVVYGPLANGATTLMYEGVPSHPDYSRYWQIIDRHRVNTLYTSPTAIRALIRQGDGPLKSSSRKTLRLLGSVGEPINPEAWRWYYEKVGESRCPIVDTWWQTETGAIVISPLPGATALKPGSATLPFFGVEPVIVDDSGTPLEGACEGKLCLRQVGPGQARDLFNDHDRFIQTYFATFPGLYFTGDGARRDKDGYYWITGRVDDVINVSGHRIGTVEVESALAAHPEVAEAAVVGFPHPLKGQGIYAFVTLRAGVDATELLRVELSQWVRRGIGPIAVPDTIHWAYGLPKTRSGKILRRLLRKIASNDVHDLGDTSTLADESVLASLLGERVYHLRPATLDELASQRGLIDASATRNG